MLNDPLLETRTTPVTPNPTSKRRPKRPSPATSAKILATGLATTAMLGMSAGYALASQDDADTPTGDVTPSKEAFITPSNATVAPSPQTSPPPSVSTPAVIEIPVPDVAQAQPGTNWGNAGNNQTSAGSQ